MQIAPDENMIGTIIFIIFFALFTLVSLAVSIPLFPGNMFPVLLGIQTIEIAPYIGALVNGTTYGFIIWFMYVLVNKNIAKQS